MQGVKITLVRGIHASWLAGIFSTLHFIINWYQR